MSCPVCAGPCQCGRGDETLRLAAAEHTTVFIDPEHYDPSEEQFAASFDESARAEVTRIRELAPVPSPTIEPSLSREVNSSASVPAIAAALALKDARSAAAEAPEWKHEVSSRVSRYRNRRRSRGEHRSLALDFEAPAQITVAEPPKEQTIEFTGDTLSQLAETVRAIEMKTYAESSEAESNVIEFPRLTEPEPEPVLVELAEPAEPPAPRIFEADDAEVIAHEQAAQAAPAVAPAMPSITLEWLAENELEKPEFELPPPVAPVAIRLFGLGFDLAIAAAACLLFAATLFAMDTVPEDRSALVLAMLVATSAWCFYQGMFLTRRASTPGMRAAGLKLSGFGALPITRRELKLRAWSVMLSSVSLGLGFAWALLDEDRLSWHDRMSRTCTTIRER